MSVTERSHWRLTGELPSTPAEARDRAETSDDPAASSPADPAVQEASTEVRESPDSEPGTSAEPATTSSKTKANAETRKAALHAEIQDLLTRRNALRAEMAAPPPQSVPDVRPASSSGPLPLSEFLARPDVAKPILTDAEFFAAYPDADYGAYTRYTSRYEVLSIRAEDQQRAAIEARQSQLMTQARTYAERVQSAQAEQAFPIGEHLTGLVPASLVPDGKPVNAGNVIAQEILESEQPAALLRHLTDHPEAFHALAALPSALAVAKAIGRLEAQIGSPLTPPSPVAKTTTSAPAPVETLGRKPSASADEAKAAVAAGDFARYASAMNAKERQR
jgi:hypothetical protein